MTATDYYRPVWWSCSRCGERRFQSQRPEYPHDCQRPATIEAPIWIKHDSSNASATHSWWSP